jgi:hypothetical protein
MSIITAILNKNFEEANSILEENFHNIVEKKMFEMKKVVSAKMENFEIATSMINHRERMRKLDNGVNEADDPLEKNLPVINQTGGSQERSERLASMARSQPSNTPAPAPTQADKQKATQFEQTEPGEESSMARSELASITKNAKAIMAKIKGNKELEAWTQSKITKSADYMTAVSDYMDGEKLDEARINIIKARIRGGKIQRRKRVSNVPGMTIRGGQLKRMSAAERRARKLGAKRAKIKTRGKQAQILRKRRLSLQKRQRLGL